MRPERPSRTWRNGGRGSTTAKREHRRGPRGQRRDRWPMTETLMPGGGVARRPLHFIVMADCSGSMKGEKMQALNYALRSMLPHLVTWERDQVQAQLLIRILTFATVPHWHVGDPVPVAELVASWRNLEYVPM